MRIGFLALAASGLMWACSPANGKEVRVFSGPTDHESLEQETDPEGTGWFGEQGGSGGGEEPWSPPANGGSSANPGSGGSSPDGNAGAGGAPPGAGGSPGTGGSPAGSGGSNNPGGAGGTPAQGGASGSGGATTVCTYPSSGYGTGAGSVVAPSVSWNGYAPKAGAPSSIAIDTFFDCDGSLGINALLLVYGAGWCTACQEEAAQLPTTMQSWGPAGVVIVELLVETASGNPASAQTAKQWRDAFQLDNYYVAADPSFQLQSAVADSFPYKVLVDPRTMTIVTTYTGGTGDDAVLQLALKNK